LPRGRRVIAACLPCGRRVIAAYLPRGRRVIAAGLLAAAGLALLPAAASAHAYLISTSPPVNGVVRSSPTRVRLTFDEGVSVPSLAVYDSAGRRVDSRMVTQPVADTIAVTIPHLLATGTYTVAWRVTSADTHVVHGVFTFSVGRRGQAGAIGARLLARGQVPSGIAFGFGVVRYGNLLLLLLCGGGAAALVLVLRDLAADVRRVLLRALTVAGLLLALLALLGLPFEAAEADGSSLLQGFGAGALAVVRHQRFGEVWLVRAWLALLFALLALSLQFGVRRWRTPREIALALGGVCLVLTATAAGHASVGGTVALIADGAHITAAAAWLGGLVFVLAAVAASPADSRWRLAMRSVPRFSLLATVAVVILGVAGMINAYLEVGAWRGLWDTTYGLLVLVKLALALPLLALGALNNRIHVPALRSGAALPAVRRRFATAAAVEIALLAVIVGVTAALVGEAPAKNVVVPFELAKRPAVSTTTTAGPFTATVTVSPALIGYDTLDMSVTGTRGSAPAIGEVDLAADPPARGVAPVKLNVVQLSPDHFRVTRARLGLAGTWHLEMTVRTNRTEWLTRFRVRIESGGRG
jgi:copper transport protein